MSRLRGSLSDMVRPLENSRIAGMSLPASWPLLLQTLQGKRYVLAADVCFVVAPFETLGYCVESVYFFSLSAGTRSYVKVVCRSKTWRLSLPSIVSA